MIHGAGAAVIGDHVSRAFHGAADGVSSRAGHEQIDPGAPIALRSATVGLHADVIAFYLIVVSAITGLDAIESISRDYIAVRRSRASNPVVRTVIMNQHAILRVQNNGVAGDYIAAQGREVSV